LFSKVGTC